MKIPRSLSIGRAATFALGITLIGALITAGCADLPDQDAVIKVDRTTASGFVALAPGDARALRVGRNRVSPLYLQASEGDRVELTVSSSAITPRAEIYRDTSTLLRPVSVACLNAGASADCRGAYDTVRLEYKLPAAENLLIVRDAEGNAGDYEVAVDCISGSCRSLPPVACVESALPSPVEESSRKKCKNASAALSSGPRGETPGAQIVGSVDDINPARLCDTTMPEIVLKSANAYVKGTYAESQHYLAHDWTDDVRMEAEWKVFDDASALVTVGSSYEEESFVTYAYGSDGELLFWRLHDQSPLAEVFCRVTDEGGMIEEANEIENL